MTNPASSPDDFDTPWKDALTRYLPEFLACYFPQAHAVIDWLLHLPAELERRLWHALNELERNANMPCVTSVQRLGREDGRREGLREGRQEGRQEGEAYLLKRLLIRRFGNLPPVIQTRLAQASISQLDTWSERILDAATLDEVFEESPPH